MEVITTLRETISAENEGDINPSRILFILLCWILLMFSSAFGQTDPTVNTNKPDYKSGDSVIFTGSIWTPGESVKIVIEEIINLTVDTIYVVADAEGNLLTDDFSTSDNERSYSATATGQLSGAKATVQFTNSSGLMQAHNGGIGDPVISPVDWVNGNAHAGNSHYLEGQSIPYRVILRDVTVGTHVFELGFDIRHGGRNAIDYITSNNRISEFVDPIIDVAGPFTDTTFIVAPVPTNNTMVLGFGGLNLQPFSSYNLLKGPEKDIVGYNCILDSAVYTAVGDLTAAQSEARIAIYFHVEGATKDVVISWGGHISSRLDWGPDNAASDINGSPYHTRYIQFDGKGGNQDRSLKTNAVLFIPTCGVTGNTLVCGTSQSVYYASTNAPTPSYNWFVDGGASIVGSSTADSVIVQSPASGSFNVNVVVTDNSGGVESEPSDTCSINVAVIVDPVVDAGVDQDQCIDVEGSDFQLAGTASSGDIEWVVIQGNATISDSSILNPTVSILSGTDTCIVRLNAVGSCSEIFDDVILIINSEDTVTILGTDPDCLDSSATYTSSTVDSIYTYSWSVSGDASISGAADSSSVAVSGSNLCNVSFTLNLQITNSITGCTASTSKTVNYADSLAPSISGQGDSLTIACTETPSFTVPTASDNCDQNPIVVVVSDTTIPGTCPHAYTRTIVWEAHDKCGNVSGQVSQTIDVVDQVPPTIGTAGADTTISCPAEPIFTPPTATDFCDANPVVFVMSDSTTPGNCPGDYSRTITWAAIDSCNNVSATVSQTITVIDDQAPSISGQGADITIACTETPSFTPPTASDACDPNPTVVMVSDSTTPGNCPEEYSRTITWHAVDACGNISAPVSQTINVVDNQAPSISGQGADATISCPAAPVFTAPTASDACDPNPTVVMVSDSTTPGNCPEEYSRTITWHAVDACGNISAPVSQTINVVDNQAPSISGQGADATISCPAAPVFTAPTASDACDPNPTVVMVSDSTTPGNCPEEYSRTITWHAIDACGNISAIASQTITVIDDTPPVLSDPGLDEIIFCPATPVFTPPTASDNCDVTPKLLN